MTIHRRERWNHIVLDWFETALLWVGLVRTQRYLDLMERLRLCEEAYDKRLMATSHGITRLKPEDY